MSVNSLFLDVLNAAINDCEFVAKSPISIKEYAQLFNLAETHKLLAVVFDKIHNTYQYDKSDLGEIKNRAKFLMYGQVVKNDKTLDLYKDFAKHNIYPLILKGIVCSTLYPKPDLRISADEDILVSEEDFDTCVKVMNKNGFFADDSLNENENHITFRNAQKMTIEVHKKLFVRDNDFYKPYNDLFCDAYEKGVFININGVDIRILDYTHNLLYLILHSLKHFTGRGVGIRQFCDIILFADKYEDLIDWDKLYLYCSSVNSEYYALAIFKIGSKYLSKDFEMLQKNVNWSEIETDETLLLEDVLVSGIYGKVNDEQTLSGTFSFSMLKNNNKSIIKKVFCSSKDLHDKYSYAKNHPVLLPVAWVHRFFYLMLGKDHLNPSVVLKSMQIGKKRSELFDFYKINNDT